MDNSANSTQGNKASSNQADLDPTSPSSLQYVAQAINEVIFKCKILSQVKLLLEGIIKFTREEEVREKKQKATQDASLVANTIHSAIKDDIY